MAKRSTSTAVRDLIDLAAKKTGWSIAKLNRHLEKGENTLHRWRTTKMENFELGAIVELCRLAEVSMDDAFGEGQKFATHPMPEGQTAAAPELEQRIAQLEEKLIAVEPLVQIVDGFSKLIAKQLTQAWSQTGANTVDAAALTNSKIIAAIEQAQQKVGTTQQLAEDLDRDQVQKEA